MRAKPTTRAAKALATRRRMLKAAYDLFCTLGYLGTTIEAVAEKADVAVPTIYYTFGTKAALLDGSLGAAIVGFDQWREPPSGAAIEELLPWHAWWKDFTTAATALGAFEIFFAHGVAILDRVAPLVPALHGTAGDPQAAEVVATAEQRRVDSYRTAVKIVATKPGGLRPGLTTREATDVLVALFSADVYGSLRRGRGWSAVRTAHFLKRLLSAELLGAGAVPTI